MYNEYMQNALLLAAQAANEGEVPVGAVIVRNGREERKNALCHAEIEAINNACAALGGWRLFDCDLYVTLEPCPMCAGAVINARLRRVIYGASDKKAGSCGSITNLFNLPYNHSPELIGGVMEQECSEILKEFFKQLRKKKG